MTGSGTVKYTVKIDRVKIWRATTMSPFTGHSIVRYAESQEAANHLVVQAVQLEAAGLGFHVGENNERWGDANLAH